MKKQRKRILRVTALILAGTMLYRRMSGKSLILRAAKVFIAMLVLPVYGGLWILCAVPISLYRLAAGCGQERGRNNRP